MSESAESEASSALCRIGVLCNPASGRCRGELSELRRRGAGMPAVDYREAREPAAIEAVLSRWLDEGVDAVMVIGGDGTLQAVLSILLGRLALVPEQLPTLIVVGGGTTNLSAGALGSRLSPTAALAALAAWRYGAGRAPQSATCSVLCVQQQGTARYGFFFGGGAVLAGVRYFHERLRDQISGVWGPRMAFMRLLLALLRGRDHPLLPASCCRARLDDGMTLEGDYRLVVASTLERLMLGSRPFWGNGHGALRLAMMAADAPAPWWRLPAILMGYGRRATQDVPGYCSARPQHLELHLEQGWMLDGELYGRRAGADSESAALTLSAVGPIDFCVFRERSA